MICGCIGSRCRTASQHPFDASALLRFILQAEADLKPELALQEFVVRGGGSRLSSSQLRLCRFEILRLDGFLKIGGDFPECITEILAGRLFFLSGDRGRYATNGPTADRPHQAQAHCTTDKQKTY